MSYLINLLSYKSLILSYHLHARVREVMGLAPYERRVIELLRNSKDKRARKLAKKRLGSFQRGKKKVDELQRVIAESRRVAH
ncbi:putative 60S ribosomal protein L36 [Rosellinia necatrix]|uniref:60S ribosomal protein L36 n=1 Tax=Rosellinia necatrix TaxID=77044 RepID=A0A1S7ULX7_ROSNE|nr:putative 60S ribosomal protein L36 [Rosellinia necatrix]